MHARCVFAARFLASRRSQPILAHPFAFPPPAFFDPSAKPYLDALAKMNWQRPSSIQAQALPYISRGLSIVGQAHHGSGKVRCPSG